MTMRPAMRWLRSYLAPLALLLVASHQFYRVQSAGWNSWRAGGFGMYAGFHPEQTEVWIWFDRHEPMRIGLNDETPGIDTSALRVCLARANDGCLGEALGRMPKGDGVRRVEIWQLTFDPSSALLRRKPLARLKPARVR